jgi:hypothetical protein
VSPGSLNGRGEGGNCSWSLKYIIKINKNKKALPRAFTAGKAIPGIFLAGKATPELVWLGKQFLKLFWLGKANLKLTRLEK